MRRFFVWANDGEIADESVCDRPTLVQKPRFGRETRFLELCLLER